jgi:hypothetical protein
MKLFEDISIKEIEELESLKRYNRLKLIEKLRNTDIQNRNDNNKEEGK